MKIKKFFLGLMLALLSCFCTCGIAACESGNGGGDGGSSSIETGDTGSGEQQVQQATVTYFANGGQFADGEESVEVTVEKNAKLTAPVSPTREYYSFAGWAKNSLGTQMWDFAVDTPTEDIALYAVWEQQSAMVFSVEGAKIDGLKIDIFVEKEVGSVSLANKVICSQDSVWKLYYDQLGQTEIPTKVAAGLGGALSNGNNVFYILVTSKDGAQANLYELNIYRSFAVEVKYYDGETLLQTETAYTGHEYAAEYVPELTGYTFQGWGYTTEVLWEDLTLYAEKTANEYKVVYNDENCEEFSATEKTVAYGGEYTLEIPVRTGHTFLGWYDGATQLTNAQGESLNTWEYMQSVTVKAKWQANEYTVSLQTSGSGGVSGAGKYAYGSTVTITASMGYFRIFLGWYDSNDQLVTGELSYQFTMGFDVTYTAKWSEQILMVSINLTDAGSISVSNKSEKYLLGEEVVIEATTNLGYTWLGWYRNDTLLTSEQNYTFQVSAEGGIYEAKWAIAEGMENFKFSSSLKSCVITGVNDKTVATIVIPDYVTAIENNAFLFCVATSVTIGKGVKSIGSEAFKGCRYLTSVVVPSGVSSIGLGAFSGCSSLTSISIPFVGGSKKTASDTYQYPFGYIFGSSWYGDGVETVQYFYGKNTSQTVSTTYYIPSSLQSVTVTGGEILYGAFYGCKGLTSIVLPDTATTICKNAFWSCWGLTSVVIPSSVTKIEGYAFDNCWGLKSVFIPKSVTTIGAYAFEGCTALTVYCEAESKPSGWAESWNSSWNDPDRPEVWGYKKEEES